MEMIDYHAALAQSQDAMVRENGIKSFKKIIKILYHHPVSDELISQLSKYLLLDKMEMIWVIYAIVVVSHPDQKADLNQAEQRILKILSQMEPLILH